LFVAYFVQITCDAQTRARKKMDDRSFFCKISRDVRKKTAKRGFAKKEARPV
jgi:hypothetical protein